MKSKSVAKINAIITFPTSVKINFVCFTVTGSFLITIHLFGSLYFHSNWIFSDYHSFVWAVCIQTAKQMNGNQKWPSYCETYEMNFHRRWKGDDGIYFGYRFWFHCLYEQNGLFWKLFSRQWRFWNMISMIFVVLYDILHYCNLRNRKLEIRKQLDVIAHFGVSTRRAKRNTHTKGRSEARCLPLSESEASEMLT